MNIERLKEVLAQARHETGKVIIGQHDVIEKALIAIFTGNHALIEGVPGVAKTLLVRTLAHVLGWQQVPEVDDMSEPLPEQLIGEAPIAELVLGRYLCVGKVLEFRVARNPPCRSRPRAGPSHRPHRHHYTVFYSTSLCAKVAGDCGGPRQGQL